MTPNKPDNRVEEIYVHSSTEGIKHPKVGDLKLNVISQWDFVTNPVCFRTQEKTFGGGTITIPYSLERCVDVVSDTHTKWEKVEKLEKEIIEHLESRGYTIAKNNQPLNV